MNATEAEEKKVLSTILTKLESIEAKLDEMNYPPEEAIKESFIKKVEAAEDSIRSGRYKKMPLKKFRKTFSP